jgi:hypothetical protein
MGFSASMMRTPKSAHTKEERDLQIASAYYYFFAMTSLLVRTLASRGQLLSRRLMARQQYATFSTYQLDPSPNFSTSSSRIPSSYALDPMETVHSAGEFIAPVSEREMIMDQPWVQIFTGGAMAIVGLMWLGEMEATSSKQTGRRRGPSN